MEDLPLGGAGQQRLHFAVQQFHHFAGAGAELVVPGSMKPSVLREPSAKSTVRLVTLPSKAFNFLKALSVRVRYNTRQIDSLSAFKVPSRLARKLLEWAQGHGVVEADGVRIPTPPTQSDLASLIGTTRESINKALDNFRRQGLIRMQGGRITIIDPEALRASCVYVVEEAGVLRK